MDLVSVFAAIVKNLVILELSLRFCLAPRKLFMDKYALTCYFNSSFKMQKPKNLIYWILMLNLTLKDKADLVREYPASHENTKRAGAKIIAFKGDQVFLDSLYLHHKDYPFTIRFGGNLYIRGGERISPDDPTRVHPRRPRLSREASKQLISGSGKSSWTTESPPRKRRSRRRLTQQRSRMWNKPTELRMPYNEGTEVSRDIDPRASNDTDLIKISTALSIYAEASRDIDRGPQPHVKFIFFLTLLLLL